jgi:long-chain fatty acid transport protein
MRLRAASLLLAAGALAPAAAWGGGYDTPMLYSARHMGMGGAAIGYVDDPSALFHNPAGLAHIGRMAFLGDFSLLLARTHASPALLAEDVDSELTVAPGFLVGAGYRITRRLTLGLGVYPIASAGAEYKYQIGDTGVENRTRLFFLEISPALAVNLPGRVRLGAGYRVTYVSLERFQGNPQVAPGFLNFAMNGFNFAGFRVGAQWTARDWLEVGASYRHKTVTKVTNTQGVALGQTFTNVETTFLLPSRLGLGARADLGPASLTADAEYTWQSQNDAYPLIGTPPPTDAMPDPEPLAIDNVYDWKDAVTLRAGFEYRLLPVEGGSHNLFAGRAADGRRLALRVGYIFDGTVTNKQFPSPFGTPPGPSHIFTVGAGWDGGSWQVNLAYGYRFGEGAVTAEDIMSAERVCRFCGIAGSDPYKIHINALYFDFSYKFD